MFFMKNKPGKLNLYCSATDNTVRNTVFKPMLHHDRRIRFCTLATMARCPIKMKMRVIALFVILSISIGTKGQVKSQTTSEQSKAAIALAFINDYVKYCGNKDS